MSKKESRVSREELKKRILTGFKTYLESKNDLEKNQVVLDAIEELKKKL